MECSCSHKIIGEDRVIAAYTPFVMRMLSAVVIALIHLVIRHPPPPNTPFLLRPTGSDGGLRCVQLL